MLPDFRARQRDYLLEISQAITQELNLSRVLARILDISVEMLAGQAGLIALRQDEGGWVVAATHGIPDALVEYLEPLLAAAGDTDDPERFELPEINRLLQNLARSVSLGLLTGVGLPLIVRRHVVGTIFVFRSYLGMFSPADRNLLKSFADQAAIAVSNARLYTQVSREKQRLDALLDSAADGMLILLPDHTIERINPAFEHMVGLTAEKLLGMRHEDVVRWAGRESGPTLEQAEADGWPLTRHATLYVEGNLARDDQAPLPVGITYAPLFSADGRLINIIATLRDITRFREAEEIKRTFVSVISHELKTPVALIKGYVSTLRRSDASWDRAVMQDSLEVIEEEADRLADMIENLLDATRLQAGGFKINLCDLSLPALARSAAERFRTQTGRHTITADFPEDFPVVLADEGRIYQVLSNLISNAIKYAPEGEICISGSTRPDRVIVCVADQGPGISAEDLPHVFDRFYRAERASKTTKGAGLGLYLARAIVEAHHGRMWVDPQPGEGARICFSLPR
ncbi:MAG: ATP-binding protein [Chloroflexota bacterium]